MSAVELPADLLRRVLAATGFDYCDCLYWREDGGVLSIYANCSDFFAWACSDVEPIETEADVVLLEQCLADLRDATNDRYPMWLTELYAARRRQLQPAPMMLREGSQYRIAEAGIRALFEALPPQSPAGVQRPGSETRE